MHESVPSRLDTSSRPPDSYGPDAAPESKVDAPGGARPIHGWLRRVGAVGFLFFLVKGLAWLAVPLILAESCTAG